MFRKIISTVSVAALLIFGSALSSCNENRNENVQEEGVEDRLEEGSDAIHDSTDHQH